MGLVSTIGRKAAKLRWFVATYGQHLPLAAEAVVRYGCQVTRLSGRLREGEESIDVLYVGRGRNFAYLARSLFEEHGVAETVDRTVFSYGDAMQKMAAGADIVIVDIGWPYHRALERSGQYVVVPDWISMTVDLSGCWDDVVANFRRTARKHDLRLVRRNEYRCESVHDRQSIEKFYDEMHVPFVHQRHGGDSAIAPRRHVVARGLQGSLLHIMRGSELVAAGIIYPEGEVMFSLWLGLPPEHLAAPPEAAFSALYYFGMQRAFEQGCRWFDFGGTRAFLADGAFQFKRRWGPLIEDWFSPSSILLRPADTSGALAFCRRTPVLRRTVDGLEALVVSADDAVDAETFRGLEKAYGCRGIDRVTVIAPGQGQDTERVAGDRADCEYRLVRCPPREFVNHYVGHGGLRAGGSTES